jgi:hypothetical protein
MSCCEENNHNCRQGRDCPLRDKIGNHAFRFYDLKNSVWFVIPLLVILIIGAMFYSAQAQKNRTAIYDCRIAEISPDFPPKAREECRKLNVKK